MQDIQCCKLLYSCIIKLEMIKMTAPKSLPRGQNDMLHVVLFICGLMEGQCGRLPAQPKYHTFY